MFIAVRTYGDYDIPTTEAVFEIPDATNIKQLLQSFADDVGLTNSKVSKSGIDGLSDKDSAAASTLLVEWLKRKKGYHPLKIKTIEL